MQGLVKACCLCLVLAAAIAAGQEIVLDAPREAIEPREYCQILVSGLSDADLTAASIEWSPRSGTTLMPARMWGGQPFLFFSAKQAGSYTITVSLHAWRTNLDASIEAAKRAAIDEDSLSQLAAIQSRLAAKYPCRSGRCVVEVAGPNPPPPPPPPPDKTAWALLLETAGTRPPALQQLILELRNHPWLQNRRLQILDRNAKTSDDQTVPAVSAALAAAGSRPLPLLCGFSDSENVAWVVELPATAEEVITLLKEKGLP